MSNWQGVEPQPVSLVYQGVPRKKWMIKPTNNGLRNKMLQIHFWSKKILPKLGCREGCAGVENISFTTSRGDTYICWFLNGPWFHFLRNSHAQRFFNSSKRQVFWFSLVVWVGRFEFRLDPPKITRDCYWQWRPYSKLPGPKPPIYHQLKTGPRRFFFLLPRTPEAWWFHVRLRWLRRLRVVERYVRLRFRARGVSRVKTRWNPKNLDLFKVIFYLGGFKYFLFSSLLREDILFDYHFSDGLKPPDSYFLPWHHFSPPFGKICLELFRSLEMANSRKKGWNSSVFERL